MALIIDKLEKKFGNQTVFKNLDVTFADTGFTVTIREVRLSAGANFIVPLTGAIMTMPGLPKVPAANNIDVDEDGNISGLF